MVFYIILQLLTFRYNSIKPIEKLLRRHFIHSFDLRISELICRRRLRKKGGIGANRRRYRRRYGRRVVEEQIEEGIEEGMEEGWYRRI